MNRTDLVSEVAVAAGVKKATAKDVLDELERIILREMAAGREVAIRNFGSFRSKRCRPRVGRNPKTGEEVLIPERMRPQFSPSGYMIDSVGNGR